VTYRFHRAPLAEHLDQVAYYESRMKGLGSDYLYEFEKLMERVRSAQEAYPQIDDSNLRKAGFSRFPFHAIYRVEKSHLVILAIAHRRRRPAYWVGRIGE
jgi:hypothetical protein